MCGLNMAKQPSWKRLSSGKYVDLNNLKEEDVDLFDIEESLNNIIRFNGHGGQRSALTVAQHSLLCVALAQQLYPSDKELHRAVFAHDFAEAYTGDIPTPVKKALGVHYYDWVRPIEDVVNKATLGYVPIGEEVDKIKLCDKLSLDIERRSMWSDQRGKDKWPEVPDFGLVQEKVEFFKNASSYSRVSFDKVYRTVEEGTYVFA